MRDWDPPTGILDTGVPPSAALIAGLSRERLVKETNFCDFELDSSAVEAEAGAEGPPFLAAVEAEARAEGPPFLATVEAEAMAEGPPFLAAVEGEASAEGPPFLAAVEAEAGSEGPPFLAVVEVEARAEGPEAWASGAVASISVVSGSSSKLSSNIFKSSGVRSSYFNRKMQKKQLIFFFIWN